MPFINQLFLSTRISFGELVAVNVFIVIAILVLDRRWGVYYEEERKVLYEKIDLIKPENYDLLLDDLRQRTGLKVKRCVVNEINFMRDVASITIYYDDPPQHA